MPNRNEKVANNIKELAATFLGRENNRTSLITVTSADCSPDLKRATVYITVLPTEKEKTAVKNSPAETAWHTISYRCYPRFRGKGLMKGFVRFVMNLYIKKNPNIKLWAGLDAKNVASGGLAAALGFKPDEQHSDPDKHWLVMVKE